MTPDWIKPARVIITAILMLAVTGCPKMNAPRPGQPPLRTGFTCCNLHYEGDWINDGNYAELPMIPAGTPAKVFSYNGTWAAVDIGGKPFRLGHDYGRAQETVEQWVAKLVVPADPKPKIANFPPDVQEAIRLGKVLPGMTKPQVIVAIGYPLTSENASLAAPMWRNWISSFGEYQLIWDNNGALQDVVTDPTVRTRIVYQPPSAPENQPPPAASQPPTSKRSRKQP